MSKLNIDELFQQKLNQLEVPHKPEYWTQMEEELETAAPVGVGGVGAGLTKIYTITGIVTSVVVISIISYFAFKNHSSNKDKTQMLTTSVTTRENTLCAESTLVKKQTKQYETQKEKSIASELTTKISNSNEKSNSESKIITSNASINTTPNNSGKLQAKSDTQSTKDATDMVARNEVSPIIVADLIAIDSSDKFFSYDPKSIIKSKFYKNDKVEEETSIDNKLIVIKPITKPTKSVFKRRKGLLYRLGIRK